VFSYKIYSALQYGLEALMTVRVII